MSDPEGRAHHPGHHRGTGQLTLVLVPHTILLLKFASEELVAFSSRLPELPILLVLLSFEFFMYPYPIMSYNSQYMYHDRAIYDL